MDRRVKDLTGRRFGRLQVHKFEKSLHCNAFWACQCDCGKSHTVAGKSLLSGACTSCGCLRKERAAAANSQRLTKHGHTAAGSNSRTYRIWSNMVSRCTNPKFDAYPWYGGRGITVCAEWREFKAFLNSMGRAPDGKSIDRIESNGNYEPGNCRWADAKTQQRNTRKNVRLEIDGTECSIAEWAEQPGAVSAKTIYGRIAYGWEPRRAVFGALRQARAGGVREHADQN